MSFVANFIRFPAMQNFKNWLRFDKVTESYMVGTFLTHSVDFVFTFTFVGHLKVIILRLIHRVIFINLN